MSLATPTGSPVNLRRHITSLDGLRGVAILVVFLHHYYPRQRMNPVSIVASLGWVGVDLFFVLSGFLITGILYDTLGQPGMLTKFFARRGLRLFPVYLFVIGIAVVFSGPLQMPLSWRDVGFFAYGANITDALGLTPSFGPYLRFRHLWSLAVEEQFYLLWAPLVVLLGSRLRIMKTCMVGIGIAVLLRGVAVYFLPPHTPYEALFTRMDSLLCGGLLAMGLRGEHGVRWLDARRLRWMIAIGLCLFVVGAAWSHSLNGERAHMLLVGYVGNDLWCTGVLGLTLLPGSAVNRCMNFGGLRFLGRYSYGLYLWHEIFGPVFDKYIVWAEGHIGPPWVGGTLATLGMAAICLGVAVVSYHAVELPFLKLKRFFEYEKKSMRAV